MLIWAACCEQAALAYNLQFVCLVFICLALQMDIKQLLTCQQQLLQ